MALLLDEYDALMGRDEYVHKYAITMSMLGKCRRQAAYALRDGWPESEGGSSPESSLGSLIHDALLPKLADRLGGTANVPVELPIGPVTVGGTADLILDDAALDLKTVSENYYAVVSEATPIGHKMQTSGYALAEGKQKAQVLYVSRDYGKRHLDTWDAEEYVGQIGTWVADTFSEPEEVPRDQAGPGLSIICDSCPFKVKCWGPVEEAQLPQGVLVNERGVETALFEYAKARLAAKKANQDKDFWRAALEGAPVGEYGAWRLGWTGGGTKPKVDVKAAVDLLEQADLPVPYEHRPRAMTIAVTAVHKDEE